MKRNYYSCLWLFLSFLPFCVAGQSPVTEVGKVKKVTTTASQINLETENAFVRIEMYSPSVIRVRINKRPLTDLHSYAVIALPASAGLSVQQTASTINFSTDSLKGVITKAPFSLRFYTPDEQLINKDEEGLTTSWIGDQVTTYKSLQDGERFIGLGEKTGSLDRRGSGYTNWNTDAFGYSVSQDPIYSSIPFYIGVHHGLQYGIFFDNTNQSQFNFGASNNRFSSFGAAGGEMNYYFIYHTQVAGIINSYTKLTGRMQLPPLWSLGYQQNRYSYYPETEVLRIAQTLREKKIPADGITLDIHYMDAYKIFTWDKSRFPSPKGLTDQLNAMGLKTTVIADPGIKVEKGYGSYERGLKEDIFIKYPDGKPYTGEVWPGWCHFPDFTSPAGRSWWGNEMKAYVSNGVAGIWNDMNEIATWGQKMPDNVLFGFDGRTTTHKEAHNVYGMLMARASYEGFRQGLPGKRPFMLTRAGYAGLQRYTALWTGDNRSEDDHMLAGVRLINSLGLSGVSFTGMDIGGFTGGASVNLFIRWMQLGAFTPYYRNHTAVNTPSAEPWTFGEEALEISRNYVNLRYRLMPYLYSGIYGSTQNGMPLNRSLAIDYTHDPLIYKGEFQNEYLFGKSLLVIPVAGNVNFTSAYFPQGSWYDLYTGSLQEGNVSKLLALQKNKLPVYARGGGIITMQSLVQSTAVKPSDTLTVYVYKGADKNEFEYYEDDGESYAYENGNYYKRHIVYDPSGRTITFSAPSGNGSSQFKWLRIVFTGFDALHKIKLNERELATDNFFVSMLDPVSAFDPQGSTNEREGYTAPSIVIAGNTQKITIQY